jgi:hypothetical protein
MESTCFENHIHEGGKMHFGVFIGHLSPVVGGT